MASGDASVTQRTHDVRFHPEVAVDVGHPRGSVVHVVTLPEARGFDPGVSHPAALCLLTGFELRFGGRSVSLPMSSQRVLAFLSVQERPVLRAFAAGSLWLDTPEERANANLRSALWRLNRLGPRLIDGSNGNLRLTSGLRVDFREISSLARSVLDHRARVEALSFAEVSLSGNLLPQWYDDWVVVERERFRQLRLHALESLSEQLTALGRLGQAVEAALAAVASEPLRESAHRVLIKAYLAEGNRGEALLHYRAFRDLLSRELGVEPSPRMAELIRDLQPQFA